MGYKQGQKIKLSGAAAYVSSTATKKSGTKTGTFYIWSAATKNGRIRITIKSSYCGKSPASKYVTCWVKTSSIKTTSSSSSTKTSSSSSAKSSTSSTKTTTTTTATKTTTTATTTSATSASSTGNTTVTKTTVAESNVTPTSTAPGQIGYLGLVLIIVSSEQIKQLTGFNWDASVNYTEHTRHLKRPTLEMTSINSDTISFKLTLSEYLGTKVMTDYKTLKGYLENGTAVPLKIGSTSYGNYRWIITALGFEGETTDGDGNWITATVSVTLKSVEKTA